MHYVFGENELRVQGCSKTRYDPENLCNPGKCCPQQTDTSVAAGTSAAPLRRGETMPESDGHKYGKYVISDLIMPASKQNDRRRLPQIRAGASSGLMTRWSPGTSHMNTAWYLKAGPTLEGQAACARLRRDHRLLRQ